MIYRNVSGSDSNNKKIHTHAALAVKARCFVAIPTTAVQGFASLAVCFGIWRLCLKKQINKQTNKQNKWINLKSAKTINIPKRCYNWIYIIKMGWVTSLWCASFWTLRRNTWASSKNIPHWWRNTACSVSDWLHFSIYQNTWIVNRRIVNRFKYKFPLDNFIPS